MGRITEEEAGRWIRARVEMRRLTRQEVLKMAEPLGILMDDIRESMAEAEQAGEAVPEGLRQLAELGAEQLNTLSAGAEEARRQLEELVQAVERASKGFAALGSAVVVASDFYDVVVAVSKALGYDVELTEEARRSRERLAAPASLLNYITQTYSMVQQALQLQLLGAGESSKLLLNTVEGLADAMRDGIVTNEEFRKILSKLGVDAGNVAGSLHGLLISSLEATRRALEELPGC
ncbi:MAG: hypothetical protein NXY59_01800 [Aigarchaeota archaeon]|nr:hypothetical protein [Candidatus Pelearchaeum maunauluense]